jgi:adenine-specific DNA glycosylase
MGMKRHQNIAHEILNWYAKNARDLPWRKTEDPYNIWVSEVMLQQTQVSRVIDYYARFLNKFPTVHHLAKAEWDDFLPVWRGLGFYSRGKNMLRTGKIVAEKYAGVFPQSKKELESLPGIGPYTASAILSFAHKKTRTGDRHESFTSVSAGVRLHGKRRSATIQRAVSFRKRRAPIESCHYGYRFPDL